METPGRKSNITEYELNSIEGDEGFSNISIVLHGNSSEADCERISKVGMTVQEGRATVSTDLAHAMRWAATNEKRHYSKSPTERIDDEVGRIFVLRIPEDLHLGYGMFTSEKIDDTSREVKGAPIKYASGRKQLAFYSNHDTEASRRQIEAEYTRGRQPSQLNLQPDTIIGSIYPSEELGSFVDHLQRRVKGFEELDTAQYSEELTRLLTTDKRNALAEGARPDDVARQLVASTVESVAISRARNLALDVMRALGYTVIKENGEVDAKAVEPANITRRVQEMYQKSHSKGFHLGPEWLQKYLRGQSKKMMAQVNVIS